MTQDEINLMVEQAGFHGVLPIGLVMDSKQLETLIKLAAAKERESIIQIIKAMPFSNWFQFDVIEAIRARGQA
jgi:hypothetical protein